MTTSTQRVQSEERRKDTRAWRSIICLDHKKATRASSDPDAFSFLFFSFFSPLDTWTLLRTLVLSLAFELRSLDIGSYDTRPNSQKIEGGILFEYVKGQLCYVHKSQISVLIKMQTIMVIASESQKALIHFM